MLLEEGKAGLAGKESADGIKRSWKPTQDRLIVKPHEQVEKVGSIWLPPNALEKQYQCTVLAAGPGRYEGGFWVPNLIKPGDVVLIGKHAGYDFKFDGMEVVLIREGDVQAVYSVDAPPHERKDVPDEPEQEIPEEARLHG